MKFSWSLLAFVFLPAFTVAVLEINDTTIYKPCIQDTTECPAEQECFQYFCYPKQGATDPLKSCTKNSQCEGWTSRKDHTEKCYKNGKGVCVPKEDNEMCEAHVDCKGRGDKCCNDYCCNVEYFDALLKIACPEGDGHEDCEVRYRLDISMKLTPNFFKDVSFHFSFHVKFRYMGCCDFSINNPQNTCFVT